MEIAKYSFYRRNDIAAKDNDWEHTLYSFLAALYKNGQILNKYLNLLQCFAENAKQWCLYIVCL